MYKHLISNSSMEQNQTQFKYIHNEQHRLKIKSKVSSLKNTEKQIVIQNDKLFNKNLKKENYKVLKKELKDLYNHRSKLEKEIFWLFFQEE